MNRPAWYLTAIFVLAGCGLCLFFFRERQHIAKAVLPVAAGDRPEDRVRERSHDYVGWTACAECHQQRVQEFQHTRHFHAITFPTDAGLPSNFQEGLNTFAPFDSLARFAMTKTADGASIEGFSVSFGNTLRAQSPVEFIYGSGAGTDEVYFTRKGDRLFELPVVWLPETQQWGSDSFNPHSPGDFSRPLTPQCLECHNTWVDYHRGTLNEYGPFEPHLMRVTCERCHGPAKSHVEHHRSHPGEKAAAFILQPKQIGRERQMDLCAQCHTNTVRYRQAPFSYRAGKPLEEYFRVLEMDRPEDDRVANQVRYLKESRCYQQSETLTCVTCHDPHRARDAVKPFSSSQSCANCHDRQSCGAQARLPMEIRDNCAGCHMPARNKIQVHFETKDGDIVFPAPRYEHRIGIYPDAEWELTLKTLPERSDGGSDPDEVRLRDRLADYWTKVGESARTEFRFARAIDAYRNALKYTEAAELAAKLAEVSTSYRDTRSRQLEGAHFKQSGKLQDAISQFESLLQINPNSATAHYELGTLLAATGKPDEAEVRLKRASELDRNDPAPHAMLGWIRFLGNRPADAYQHYVDAESVEPWSDSIEFMLAQCLVRMGQDEKAISACERAIEINPRHRDAARVLRKLLGEHGEKSAALQRVNRIVQATRRQQPELLLLLAEIHRDLNQRDESSKILAEAQRLAEKVDPALVTEINILQRAISEAPERGSPANR